MWEVKDIHISFVGDRSFFIHLKNKNGPRKAWTLLSTCLLPFQSYFHPSPPFSVPQDADLYGLCKQTILTFDFERSLAKAEPQLGIGGREESNFVIFLTLALSLKERAPGWLVPLKISLNSHSA